METRPLRRVPAEEAGVKRTPRARTEQTHRGRAAVVSPGRRVAGGDGARIERQGKDVSQPGGGHEGGNDMPVMPAEAFLTIPFSLFTAHQALPWLNLTVALGLSALIGRHSLPRSWRRVRRVPRTGGIQAVVVRPVVDLTRICMVVRAFLANRRPAREDHHRAPGRFKHRLFSLRSWATVLWAESRCSGGVDGADAR